MEKKGKRNDNKTSLDKIMLKTTEQGCDKHVATLDMAYFWSGC